MRVLRCTYYGHFVFVYAIFIIVNTFFMVVIKVKGRGGFFSVKKKSVFFFQLRKIRVKHFFWGEKNELFFLVFGPQVFFPLLGTCKKGKGGVVFF
jgi:hypothetical protein